MIDRDELEIERADVESLVIGNNLQLRLDLVFLELGFHERERQARSVQGDVLAQSQQIRHGTDVVFVSVRQDNSDDVVEPVADRGEVGKDQVDSRLGLFGEQHTAVNDE
ncbi:unannotated protein [freshwater metagenome]|uniref:Unannotated protein n=1 Tax=freshwater metagenome TaxID=449393 RepID=A0A6J6J801_9ZZZZ